MQIKVDRELNKCRRFLRDRIRPFIEEELSSCTVAAYVNSGEPEPPKNFIRRAEAGLIRFHPVDRGDAWGTNWGTTWFRVDGRLPMSESGHETEIDLIVDLGWNSSVSGGQCEGLVFAKDGRAIKGVQPMNAWVRLQGKGAMAGLCDDNGAFRLYVEAGCNPMLLNIPQRSTDLGEEADGRVCAQYAFHGISLCRFDRELWEYARDLEVVTGLLDVIDKNSVRYWQVMKALQTSLNHYDDDHRAETLGQARHALAGVLSKTNGPTIFHDHAVGHAHIDTAYLWPKRETRRKIGRTVANVLALMDQDDEFVFAMSSAQQFAWLEEDYPDLFRRVKERIDQGRFIPVGGMWVEADAMMPSGESLVRQITNGRRYFKDHLGISPKGIWLPDSFGYTGAFPQIARRAGYSWFLSQKLSWNDTTKFPHHSFIWEGIDGSPILTHFPPTDTYAAEITPGELRYSEMNAADKEWIDQGLLLYGYGDGGGGPTREMLGRLSRLRDLEGVPTCTSASPDDFFQTLADQMNRCDGFERPRWHGELYLQLHRATLTAQQDMKADCRREEGMLRTMEYLGCLASLCHAEYRYPSDRLQFIWHRLLLNQFHDILPGSSISWVHREARQEYEQDMSELSGLIQSAADTVAEADPDLPVLQKGYIAQKDWLVRPSLPDDCAVDDGCLSCNDSAPQVHAEKDGFVMENAAIRVVITNEGLIVSLRDLKAGRELVALDHALGSYRLLIDKPCERDAWELDRDAFLGPIDGGEVVKVEPVCSSVSAGVEITTAIGAGTTIRTQVLLDGQNRSLRFHAYVDWQERDRFLKVDFPLNVQTSMATYECQYGTVDRPVCRDDADTEAAFECCTHRFVHLHEGGYGVGLVNESTYGSSVFPVESDGDNGGRTGTLLELSLLSAPTFPDPNTDVGRSHEFTWEVLPGANVADTVKEAGVINAPTIAHLPQVRPLIQLRQGKGTVILDWVKPADDGSKDIIVRLYEPVGESATADILADDLIAEATVCETDLLEVAGATHGMPSALEGAWIPLQGAHLNLRPYQLTTLRIRP